MSELSYEELREQMVAAVYDLYDRSPDEPGAEGIADVLLAGPLAPLLAKLQAVGELASEYADTEHDHYIGEGHPGCSACWVDDIRHALDAS